MSVVNQIFIVYFLEKVIVEGANAAYKLRPLQKLIEPESHHRLHEGDGATIDLNQLRVIEYIFQGNFELILFSTFANLSDKMNPQSFQLIPDRHILFKIRLQLFKLFFLEYKLRLTDNNLINFIILPQSHQQFKDDSSRYKFKQYLYNMNIAFFTTNFQDITLAVGRQSCDYLHCIFRHVKEHVIRLRVSNDRHSEKRLFNLFELFLRIVNTQLSYLLQCIGFGRFGSVGSDQLQNFRDLTYSIRVMFAHFSVEDGLILLFNLGYLLFNAIYKLIHVMHFTFDMIICFQAKMYLLWLIAQAVGQPLDFYTRCHRIDGYLHILLSIFELFHMNHDIPDLIVGALDRTRDIFMVVHEFRHDIQFGQVILIVFQLVNILDKVLTAPNRQRIHMIDEFIENQGSFLCIHLVRFISIIFKLIQLIRQLMFKRSPTLDKQDQHAKDKQSELLVDLNKCIYLPYDDKMIVRTKIKQKDDQVLMLFEEFRKNKVLSELQVNLRKYVKQQKERIADQHQDSNPYRKHSIPKRVYSQQSLHKSKPTSRKASPQRQQSKNKIIKIDINQLRKKMMDNTQKLCINSTRNDSKSSLQAKQFKSKRFIQSKPQNEMNRKKSVGTLNYTEREHINYYELNTEPELYYLQRSHENVNQLPKSSNHYLLNEVFFTQDIQSLMKSKLSKRKASTPSNILSYAKQISNSSKVLHQLNSYSNESNKENMEIHNRLQSRQTPFFTDRPSLPIYESDSRTQLKERQSTDPKFGQFFKKIKQIMKGDR